MPWALDEPQTLEQKIELVESFRSSFDAGENFTYATFAADEAELLGGTGLHPRVGPGGLEIGVPRKLGFVEEATLRRRLPGREGGPLRDLTIFTMFREDFDPAVAPGIRAFDAQGKQVL